MSEPAYETADRSPLHWRRQGDPEPLSPDEIALAERTLAALGPESALDEFREALELAKGAAAAAALAGPD